MAAFSRGCTGSEEEGALRRRRIGGRARNKDECVSVPLGAEELHHEAGNALSGGDYVCVCVSVCFQML